MLMFFRGLKYFIRKDTYLSKSQPQVSNLFSLLVSYNVYYLRALLWRHSYKFLYINSAPLIRAISLILLINMMTSWKKVSFLVYSIPCPVSEDLLSQNGLKKPMSLGLNLGPQGPLLDSPGSLGCPGGLGSPGGPQGNGFSRIKREMAFVIIQSMLILLSVGCLLLLVVLDSAIL